LEKERAELAAENKCFNCKEVGHMSRNCPNRNSVRGNSKKPPGMTNFNIEMVIKGEDSDELMEIRDEITMSAIGLPAENWCKVYPQWNQDHISARRWLGDCYAMVVETLLTKEQPYPGDDKYIYSKKILPYTRFEITRVNEADYNVKDWLTEFEISIPMYLLENNHFEVSGWYAQRRSQAITTFPLTSPLLYFSLSLIT
jgi:Zinc knuckle